jgi:hypothetical protein
MLVLALPLLGCVGGAPAAASRGTAPITAGATYEGPASAASARPAPAPSIDALPTYRSRTIPGGLTCLLRLRKLGIRHRPLSEVHLVNTPVELLGPVGGVQYKATWRARLIVDCRFALALHRAGPFFRALGLPIGYFSNTYRRHRKKSVARVSRHGLGLAMDLHRIRTRGGELLRVKRDYEKGLDDACDNASRPALNRLGCLLKRHGVFDVVLTPDTNRAHYNHFHFAIIDFERRRRSRRYRPHPVIRN